MEKKASFIESKGVQLLNTKKNRYVKAPAVLGSIGLPGTLTNGVHWRSRGVHRRSHAGRRMNGLQFVLVRHIKNLRQ